MSVSIEPVRTKADRKAFLTMPWAIYADDPHWVPPLLLDRREFLDPKKNPFFDFATVELYLARKSGKVVGRIGVVEDTVYNEYRKRKMAGFGMFESTDDPEVAHALLDAAEGWARDRGLTTMWGPVNFSTNQECGLLVEGFADPPCILMTYNPPYYEGLLTSKGLSKVKDLWAFELHPHTPPPEKVKRIAEKIRKKQGIVVRPVEMKKLQEEIERMEVIYNSAWEDNWGFAPMTKDEFKKMGADLKMIVRPELVLIAEVKGEPVAFSLTLPDFNEALQKLANGRLLPTGLFKLLYYKNKIQRVRLVALGIREEWRKRGIDSILYLDTIETAKRMGYTRGEVSWTLEDNQLVNRAIEVMGGTRYKTYRLYEKPLAA